MRYLLPLGTSASGCPLRALPKRSSAGGFTVLVHGGPIVGRIGHAERICRDGGTWPPVGRRRARPAGEPERDRRPAGTAGRAGSDLSESQGRGRATGASGHWRRLAIIQSLVPHGKGPSRRTGTCP